MRALRFLVFVLSLAVEAKAQFIELQNIRAEQGAKTLQLNTAWSHELTPSFGISGWELVNPKYAESDVGIYWRPVSFVKMDLQVGTQTVSNPFVIRGVYFVDYHRITELLVFEKEQGGNWFLADVNLKVLEGKHTAFGVGFRVERHVGIGPRFQLDLPGLGFTKDSGDHIALVSKMAIWVVPVAWDMERADRRRSTNLGFQIIP